MEISKTLYRLKALAVISIVMAHSCYTEIPNRIVVMLFHRYATAGVFIFFLLSGYFFNTAKGMTFFVKFWKKKARFLVAPWLTGAILLFAYGFITGGQKLSIMNFINYVLGNGSFFYYLTVLCFCYLICWPLMLSARRQCYMIVLVLITVLSVLCTSAQILPSIVDKQKWVFTYLNPYLNVFNWVGIFGLGCLFREYNIISKFIKQLNQRGMFRIFVFFNVLWVGLCFLDNKISYWSNMSLLTEFCLFVCLLIISVGWKKGDTILEEIGKVTLPIYIYHMPIQSQILSTGIWRQSVFGAVLRPVLTVLLIYAILFLGKLLFQKIKLEKMFMLLLGLR